MLRNVFADGSLLRLKDAATRCFQAIESGQPFPQSHQFIRFSHSVLLTALLDYGCAAPEKLTEPLSVPGLSQLFLEALGGEWTCTMKNSWVRKKFAPAHAPAALYHPQGGHQDGALGVKFPLEPGPVIPITALLTCWIPLDPCGIDSPGLEFVRRRQPALLHFTELEDSALRQRFPPHEFWAPALEFGDGLIFLNSVLHRTHTRPQMRHNRLSVEYRIQRK